MRVRAAVPGDRPAIEAIAEAAYRGYVARIGMRPAPMDADYGTAIAAGRVSVLEGEGEAADGERAGSGTGTSAGDDGAGGTSAGGGGAGGTSAGDGGADGTVGAPSPAILGFIVLVPRNDHLLLENIAVSPDVAGRGCGARLMDFAEAECARLGLPEIRLYTNAAMTENLAYYPALGYRETGRRTEDGFDRVYFTKPLAR